LTFVASSTGTTTVGVCFRAVLIAVITCGLEAFTIKAFGIGAFFSNPLKVTAAVIPVGRVTGANGIVLRDTGFDIFNGCHLTSGFFRDADVTFWT
tara:strand:+ start:854 stop:1138 length:285 start_codon:yes stop_codon:yes gene_type:complete